MMIAYMIAVALSLDIFLMIIWWHILQHWHDSARDYLSMRILFAVSLGGMLVMGIVINFIQPHLTGTQWALMLLAGFMLLALAIMGVESAFAGMLINLDERDGNHARRT
jgi:uncharacterized membrane protein